MGVSLKCACALQLLPWRHACFSFAHAQTTMWHCCSSIKWVDKVGGSRRGLSIRLSGIFTYSACFWNQGVRIIEVLLYLDSDTVQGLTCAIWQILAQCFLWSAHSKCNKSTRHHVWHHHVVCNVWHAWVANSLEARLLPGERVWQTESLFLVFRQSKVGVVTMLKLAGYYLYSYTDLVRFERFSVLEIFVDVIAYWHSFKNDKGQVLSTSSVKWNHVTV